MLGSDGRHLGAEPGDGPQLVGHVQRGHLVRLGQGRVVEHGVHQVVDGAAAAHDGLADVHQFGGVGAEDVDAEDLAGVGVHDQLQHPVRVAGDLAAGQFAVAGDADLERDGLGGQVGLELPAVGDLRDRVDADRLQRLQLAGRLTEGVRRRPAGPGPSTWRPAPGTRSRRRPRRCAAPRSRSCCRPPAGRGCRRSTPARSRLSRVGVALPTGGVHHDLGGDPLARGQGGDRAATRALHRRHLLAEPERHGVVAQVELERLDDLGIAEVEHLRRASPPGSPGCRARRTSTRTRRRSRRPRPPPSSRAPSPARGSGRSRAPGRRRTRRWSGAPAVVPVAMTILSAVRVRCDLLSPRCRPTACAGRGSSPCPGSARCGCAAAATGSPRSPGRSRAAAGPAGRRW